MLRLRAGLAKVVPQTGRLVFFLEGARQEQEHQAAPVTIPDSAAGSGMDIPSVISAAANSSSDAILAAMGMKGNAGYLSSLPGSKGKRKKDKSKGSFCGQGKGKGSGNPNFLGKPPPNCPQCKNRGCDGYHSDLKTCPSDSAPADPHYKPGSGRCLHTVYGADGKTWCCGSKTHFARHHKAQFEREHPGQQKASGKGGKPGVRAGYASSIYEPEACDGTDLWSSWGWHTTEDYDQQASSQPSLATRSRPRHVECHARGR